MPSSDSGSSRRSSGATGSARALAAAFAAFATAFPPQAFALYGDRIEVFAAENVTYDSNVFRIPGNVDPRPLIFSNERGDWSSTTSLGFTADLPYSQQRFQASASGWATRYGHFDDLDYEGYSVRADWLWAVTSAFTGELGANQSRTLSSFSNLQVRLPDFVTSRNAWVNGAWLVTPSWRLHGALTGTREEHSNTLRSVQDIDRATAEAGLSYVTARENRIGVAFRNEHGQRPEAVLVNGIAFDNAYDQNGVGIIAHWVITGHSTLDARADYVKRDYEQFTGRNYKGPTFNGSWTWMPTGKLTFVTTAMRDVGPVEDINTSFVLVTGISFKPRWAITEKVAFTGNLDYSTWDYRTDAAFGRSFEHRVRAVGLGVSWKPLRKILMQAGWQHEKRTSTAPGSEYDVDLFLVEGRIGF